ncbi:MAG: MacB family efflux pump subunit [Rickettsiales bacterium]
MMQRAINLGFMFLPTHLVRMSPLLSLRGICRHYPSGDGVARALDDVNIDIYPGEFVAIMGQSGSGKSTLMNILGCLDRPSAGSYAVLGREASSLSRDELAALRRETFGFVFQRYNLLASASAEENVEIPAMYAGVPKAERRKRAAALLHRLGLGEKRRNRPSQLSGGQQQRVAVARALMNDAPVILADEPTGALDSNSGEEVMALMKELHAQGKTVIVITHDERVASHAGRVVRIRDGRIAEDDGLPPSFHAAPLPSPAPLGGKGNLLAETAESVTTALRALRVNIFRTALTLLGIVIGVASVITMLAVGNGSKERVLRSISELGTNLLSVRPGMPGFRGGGDVATLTIADAKAIEEQTPNLITVVPERSGAKTLRYGNLDDATQIQGVGETFPEARDWKLRSGTFFTGRDVHAYAAVIVLGSSVADVFFPNGEDPVGKFLLAGNIPFEIIGVMEAKGAAPWGQDQDDTAYVPYTTGLVRLFGSNYLNGLTIKVDDATLIGDTEKRITELLKARHGTEDFKVRNTASFLQMATDTQNTLTVLLGAVAAISLVVGGIGVMNIMLVSVVERTREIGVRMATGARTRDVMVQFNVEAVTVGAIGGLLGVAVGFAFSYGLKLLGVDVAFSYGPAALAFSSALATGIIFGYLPARKAARLNPVDALSAE